MVQLRIPGISILLLWLIARRTDPTGTPKSTLWFR